ncbi:MAG: metallophosphoesterase [Patiriisocius sp.]|uniref:metallophosphoesterase n=1 Tax=Patiriisocius sp. TaxID=2822396 RepID=UPI003EF4A1BF
MFNKIFTLFLLSYFVLSCASYEPQYRNQDTVSVYPSSKEIEKTFYLIGDAGKSPDGSMSEGLQVVKNYLKANPAKGDYAIFLGDNIYPDGMPPKGAEDRKHSEYQLDAQVESLGNFDGTMYFIPGNHDWYDDALVGLKREEDYLTEISNGKRLLQPEDGCPISSIEVTENIQLIMIDSQWYLEDWNFLPTVNALCEIKTRDKFFIELDNEIEKHQNKTIVFAMHHPMFTNGTHGGYFALEKHLYPTQRNLPLPILSSLVTQIRAQGGVSIQDRYNELYNNLMVRLGEIGKKHKRLVFTSGHEHTLQHIEKDGLIQIVTGSAAKESAASLGKDGLFSTGAQGFAVMDVFKNGSSWVRYFIAGENNEPKMVYQKEIIPPVKMYDVSALNNTFPSEVKVPVYTQDSIREALFFKTIYGKTYKEAYETPVTAKVALLDTLYGGLTPIRETGMKDFKALRLKDKNGRIYRMRALAKNSFKYSQPIVLDDAATESTQKDQVSEITVPDNFNSDFYTAAHPYATLSIPKLAQPLDIFFTVNELYYIPKQNTLGQYNEDFGGQLYYISIEPSVENDGEQIFSYPVDIETTDDILIKLRDNPSVLIDEESYITSRLFDMLIGDWDREPDHWRWAEYSKKGGNFYVPIPRDRDDAFSSFDGNILDIARSIFSGSRQTHVYRDDLRDIQWFNEEGIILDRAILKRSGEKQWVFAAKNIQEILTDEIIDEAFAEVPQEVSGQSLEDIKNTLKNRRDNLAEIAKTHHAYVANLQTLTGTDNSDYFEITRMPGGLTNIKTYEYNGGLKALVSEKTFDHAITREVWVYGLDGDDTFEVKGEDNDLIYLRVIGGRGTDYFDLKDGRRAKAYDTEDQISVIKENNGGELIFTNLYNLNTYDYRKQIERNTRYAPAFGYNPDDGLRVGLQYVYTVNSFKRNPFSKRHSITGGYYFDTNSFDVEYNGEFANSIGDSNLSIGVRLTSPNYTVNYFGYGNETADPEDVLGFDYNRIELQNNTVFLGLIRNSSFGSVFSLKAKFDSYRLQQTNNDLYQDKGDVAIEDTNYFATLEGKYDYKSFDNPLNPSRGMVFNLTAGLTENLMSTERIFGYLKSSVTFYNALTKDENLVLKSNVKSQFNFGNKFEFYQGVNAGANNGLRGYREERFTGKSALVAGGDLRYSFNDFEIELFPIQIGVYLGADVGRVWTPSENSEQWHNDYGGGLWINGAGGFGTTFSAFRSKEGTRLSFGLGFNF